MKDDSNNKNYKNYKKEEKKTDEDKEAEQRTTDVDHRASVMDNVPSEEKGQKWREELHRLGNQITGLLDFIKGKSNVHGEIRKLASSMSTSYNRVLRLEKEVSEKVTGVALAPKAAAATQTTPKTFADVVTTPRTRHGSENRERKKRTPPSTEVRKPKRKKKIREGSPPNAVEDNGNPIQKTTSADWKQVQPKRRRKQCKEPALPNALIIARKGQLSYAEILTKMKRDDNLKEVGQSVSKIRRTVGGDIILVFDKVSQEKTAEFSTAVEMALGDEAVIKSRVQLTSIEIKDLVEDTTKQEISEALQESLGGTALVKADTIKSIRKAYGGTLTAVVTLPASDAIKAINMGKVRVGWAICRIREIVRPTKCFKCWHYGHLSNSCRSTVDRSKCCIKCGGEDHKAEKCTADPCCALCRDKEEGDAIKHVAGSFKCPVYKKAYQTLIQKRE